MKETGWEVPTHLNHTRSAAQQDPGTTRSPSANKTRRPRLLLRSSPPPGSSSARHNPSPCATGHVSAAVARRPENPLRRTGPFKTVRQHGQADRQTDRQGDRGAEAVGVSESEMETSWTPRRRRTRRRPLPMRVLCCTADECAAISLHGVHNVLVSSSFSIYISGREKIIFIGTIFFALCMYFH